MNTSRAFRPVVSDNKLESRQVLSVAHPAIAAHVHHVNQHLKLNVAGAHFIGIGNTSLANELNVTRTGGSGTGAFGNLGSLLRGGRSIGFSNNPVVNNNFLNGSGFSSAANLGAQNGLAFNNGLGLPGFNGFRANGATNGLAFNNGQGVPAFGNPLAGNSGFGTFGFGNSGFTNFGSGISNSNPTPLNGGGITFPTSNA